MKKLLFISILFCIQTVWGQVNLNIAVPSYGIASDPYNASTGKITFWGAGFSGFSETLSVGHGANGVCFYSNNSQSHMFVAYDDGSSFNQGILWYPNASFSSGNFTSNTPQILVNHKQTYQVVADANGNVYSANHDGSVTKFMPSNNTYSNANQTTVMFFSNGLTGGLFIDEATGTLWAVDYSNNRVGVCKLTNFGISTSVKFITVTNGIYPNSPLQVPEGIVKDNLGNIWIGNNNTNEVSRINSSTITTIINELNANNFTTKQLTGGTEIVNFAIQGGTQLGGMVFDNSYSQKIYVNNQSSGNTTYPFYFSPTNGTPAFAPTIYFQTYPGNGQSGIVHCQMFATPSQPTTATANPSNITAGQTSTLTATGCAADQSYLWYDANGTVATTASFTTPVLNTSKTYNVECVRANPTISACKSTARQVSVTVTPCNSVTNPTTATATPSTVNSGQSSVLEASGCPSSMSYRWKLNGVSVSEAANYITPVLYSSRTYTAHCVDGSCESTGVSVSINLQATHQIVNCSQLTQSPTLFRVGTTGTNSIKVYLNILTPTTVTLTATGTNFTGTATQTFTTAQNNAFIWVPINYDGGGTAGSRTISIVSSEANVAACSNTVSVFDPPIFSFTDCSNGTINGTFVSGTASVGSLTVAISATQAGPITVNLGEFGNYRMNGTYTGSITMGQTSLTIPFTYDGTGNVGDNGQLTLYSVQALGQSIQLAGFCYGPFYTLTALPPCPNTVAVNGTTNPPAYTAGQIIRASNDILVGVHPQISGSTPININSTNSNKLYLKAGKAIEIQKGTTIGSGATFEAKIEGCTPSNPTMTVQGRFLYDTDNVKFTPVGFNFPTDYGFPNNLDTYITEADKSGGNMARIIWFQNPIPYNNHSDTNLNDIITKFAAKKIIPVVCIWDGFSGCPNNPNKLNDPNGYVSWWTDPTRVAMLNTHKKYLIINLVNELGFGSSYNAGNPSDVAAFTNWRNQYKTAITSIRNAGLHVPIMIDAPLCGTSLALINQAANELLTHDPDHNIIFDVHAYWAEGDQSNLISTAVTNNVPVIFGEISSKQVGADSWEPLVGYSECYYGIDGTVVEHAAPSGYSYKNLLPILKNNQIGWLAWEWFNDGCPARSMTTDGYFINKTTFGSDIIHEANYGMKNIAVKCNAF